MDPDIDGPRYRLKFVGAGAGCYAIGFTPNLQSVQRPSPATGKPTPAPARHLILGLLLGLVVAWGTYLLLPRGLWADVLIVVAGIGLATYWAVHNYRSLWLAGVALVPFSIEVVLPPGTAALAVPTEPLAVALLLVFVFGFWRFRLALASAVRSPLFVLIVLYWLWMLLCCFYATDGLRAFKYWLSTTWLLAMFVFAPLDFLRDARLRLHTAYALTLPLIVLVLYTLANHATMGFTFLSSSAAMQPFYKDHGAYATQLAACLAWPVLLAWHATGRVRWLWLAAAAWLALGIVFSYTRGAWLGVLFAAAVLVWLAWLRRHRLSAIVFGTVAATGIVLMLLQSFADLEEGSRKQDKTLGEHFTSILNTQRNASNQERINRWDAALQMLRARPVVGYGPGCYSEQYAPFQQSKLRTAISTNRGDLGGAHNEFLSAGAEMGIPGLLLLALVYACAIWLGVRGYLRTADGQTRMLHAGALAAVLSYFPHALINNFMDQDKVAAPVYLALALLIVLDGQRYQGTKPSNKGS